MIVMVKPTCEIQVNEQWYKAGDLVDVPDITEYQDKIILIDEEE